MPPSTRAATLCCACALYLGPAAQALFQKPALHTGGDAPLTRQVLQLPSRRIAAVADSASPALSKLASLTTSGAGLVGGGVLPSLGQADHVPSTARKKRTQGGRTASTAQKRRMDGVKLVQTALDKSHRLLLDVAAKMPNLVPRMDAQECLKRTVCEAHNKPGRYGLLGIAIQFFFPPFRPGDAEGTRMSPLQLAARYGRDPSADCGRQYDGCFLDTLQTLQAAVDYLLRRQQAANKPGSTLLLHAFSSAQQAAPPIVWGSAGGGVIEPITAPP